MKCELEFDNKINPLKYKFIKLHNRFQYTLGGDPSFASCSNLFTLFAISLLGDLPNFFGGSGGLEPVLW